MARDKSPPFKSYSASTPVDIHNPVPGYGSVPVPPYPKATSSMSQSSQPSSSSYHGPSFPPPPSTYERERERDSASTSTNANASTPRDIPLREKYTRDGERHRRPTVSMDDVSGRMPGPTDFQSPRDTERWDRLHESSGSSEYVPATRSYERDRRQSVSSHDADYLRERERERERERDRDRDRKYTYDR